MPFGKSIRKVQAVFQQVGPALDDSAARTADDFLDRVVEAMKRPHTTGMPVKAGDKILTVQGSGVLAGSGIWDAVGSPRRVRSVLLDGADLEHWAGAPLQVAGTSPDRRDSFGSSKADVSASLASHSSRGSTKSALDVAGLGAVEARTQALAAWQGLGTEEAWPGLDAVAAALDAVTQPAVFWPMVEAAVVEAGRYAGEIEASAVDAYRVPCHFAVTATVKVVGLRLLTLRQPEREFELRDFVVVAQEALQSRIRTARRRVNQHCREQALREREQFENPHFTAIRSATDPMAATAARFGAFWRRMH